MGPPDPSPRSATETNEVATTATIFKEAQSLLSSTSGEIRSTQKQ